MTSSISQKTKNLQIEDVKYCFETQINWKRIFSKIRDAYSDDGFRSNGDNMLRSKILEIIVSCFSELKYVDEDGVDFVINIHGQLVNIEAKFQKGYFGKKRKYGTLKMKNYRSDTGEKAFQRMKSEKKFDYVMIIDPKAYRVALIGRDVVQKYYVSSGDGINAIIPHDELTYVDLPVALFPNPSSSDKISKLVFNTIENWALSI